MSKEIFLNIALDRSVPWNVQHALIAVGLALLLTVACSNAEPKAGILTRHGSEPATTSTGAATPTLPTVVANPGWRQLPPPLISGRTFYSTTWTGQTLIIWGGRLPTGNMLGDGAAFDALTEEWQVLPSSPLEERFGHTAIWTGEEVIVWGGLGGSPIRPLRDGAAYRTATQEWRAIASPELTGGKGYVSVWPGSEMMVLGGNNGSQPFEGNGLNEAARYDPLTDIWRVIEMPTDLVVVDAIWTGTRVIVYGVEHYLGDLVGASYDPASGAWRDLPAPPVDPPVPDIDTIGDEILAWSYDPEEDGIAAFDQGSNRWRELPPLPGQPYDGIANAAALGHDQVFMQSEGTMAIYINGAPSWRLIDPPRADVSFNLAPVWTGNEALFLDPGVPPGDPNAPNGIPAQFWSYHPEEW